VQQDRPRAVSLHLYGRAMNSFHVYDVQAGTRRRVDVSHNES
jgi:3-mercaptopropionate dioxygenase